MLYIAANGLDRFLEDRENIRLRWVAVIGIVLATAAVLFAIDGMNKVKLAITIIFLLAYVGMFFFINIEIVRLYR